MAGGRRGSYLGPGSGEYSSAGVMNLRLRLCRLVPMGVRRMALPPRQEVEQVLINSASASA